ncbi:MAG: lysylphosphatidylglycerol synthase transmembrane domain-containing protein [Acidimicrobiales bacterium]
MSDPEDGALDPAPAGLRRRWVRLAVGTLVAVAAVWMAVSTAGGPGDAASAVRDMSPVLVVVALLFAAARVASFAVQLLWLARRTGPLTARTALGLALVVYGIGAVTPAAPLEGLALAAHELRRRGRSAPQARMVCGFSEWFAQRTFYGLAALDLALVVMLGHVGWSDAWPLLIVAAVVVTALVGTAVLASRPASVVRVSRLLGALRLRRPHDHAEQDRVHDVATAEAWHARAMTIVGPPSRRMRLAAVSASAVLADTGTLWATCRAAGLHVHPELILLAQVIGTVASWVPLLPGGFGVVEAAIPTVLHHFGAPLDGALAATVVYRAAGTLLPAAAGAAVVVALRRAGPSVAAPA